VLGCPFRGTSIQIDVMSAFHEQSGRGTAHAGLFPLRRRLRQILHRLRFTPERRHLVRVDPDHEIVDVVVDFREPVAGACRNDDDVARLDLAMTQMIPSKFFFCAAQDFYV
jgi:hypothetical protein